MIINIAGGIGYSDQSGGGPFSAGQKKMIHDNWTNIVISRMEKPIGTRYPIYDSPCSRAGMGLYLDPIPTLVANNFTVNFREHTRVIQAICGNA